MHCGNYVFVFEASITELQCDAGVETNSTVDSEPMNSKSPTTFALKTK